MRKRKRIIWISVICSIGLISFWQFIKLNRIHGFIGCNSINITVKEPLVKNKLLIYKGFYSINRENDETLFKLPAKQSQILFDGINVKEQKFEYGENDFLLIYDSAYYYEFRQFKTCGNAYHSYNFSISKIDSNIVLNVDIKGIEGEKFERKMNKIEIAKNLRCNTPKNQVEAIEK